eukprot:CAMPEP_0168468354 /NCGR_PEP_ID=MMETSP0228-20121227/57663_1 /TAXON_ID=133427 /ORGANISM="Protoceratium reticulatum, Strain CCCM 535 (=CCMP 1889)" /LENGTH=431 /DNA_ID=CAMNT_0008484109 /DNA_START=22 /DNA_END=1314 /DNA_ORIENTATION=+
MAVKKLVKKRKRDSSAVSAAEGAQQGEPGSGDKGVGEGAAVASGGPGTGPGEGQATDRGRDDEGSRGGDRGTGKGSKGEGGRAGKGGKGDKGGKGGKGGKDGKGCKGVKGGKPGKGGKGGKGKDGQTMGQSSTRPSALRMLKPRAGRQYTLSLALPSSIIENAQSGELKALLVGQIARALTIFSIDEVVIYEDRSDSPQSNDSEGLSRAMAFFVRNLQYLETPQYLRKQLLPMHPDLRWVGILSPLDAPHHLRKYERLAYREGAVFPADKCPEPPSGETGCWVNCGLESPVWVSGQEIPSGVRVTVRLDPEAGSGPLTRAAPVAPDEPRTKLGLYWGYQVRVAPALRAVLEECPFEGGYDLSIGTSERGEALGLSGLPKFKHLLLVFGGLGGLEEAIEDELSDYPAGTEASSLFSRYVNVCPAQTSRTIRT